VTCCTIDWFTEWPAEALRGVANEVFADVEFPDLIVSDGIVSLCRDIHLGVEKASARYKEEIRRFNYVTPTSYLELLATFKNVLAEKRDELGTAKRRLSVGLDKMNQTDKDVAIMKVELIDMQPILVKTAAEVEALMISIERDKAAAAETKSIVEVEKASAAAKAAECKEIKDSAEAGLAEALQALDAAVACLKDLSLKGLISLIVKIIRLHSLCFTICVFCSDISEVAKYSSPPRAVKLVLEGLCIMFSIAPVKVGKAGRKTDDYW
jgi:dynein heavy chain, axonemal